MLELTTTDGVRVLRMAHGKANALDLEFALALQEEPPAPRPPHFKPRQGRQSP